MLNPSLSEVRYTCLGVEQDLRSDGRGRLDYRCIEVESGVLEQSNGSARIAFGAGGTAVLASVKVEVAEPAPERPGQGFLHVNVECNPSVSPKFERRAASNLNAELTQTLDTTRKKRGAGCGRCSASLALAWDSCLGRLPVYAERPEIR